jgi:hypothetical protein
MYSIYCTNYMHIISHIWVLNTWLRHVSAQAHHPQTAQNVRFKTNCQWQATVYKREHRLIVFEQKPHKKCFGIKFTLEQAMKAQRGKRRYSCTLSLTSELDGDCWSTPRPDRFTPRKETRYPLYTRLGRPQGRSGRVLKISPPLGFDPRTVQPVASR